MRVNPNRTIHGFARLLLVLLLIGIRMLFMDSDDCCAPEIRSQPPFDNSQLRATPPLQITSSPLTSTPQKTNSTEGPDSTNVSWSSHPFQNSVKDDRPVQHAFKDELTVEQIREDELPLEYVSEDDSNVEVPALESEQTVQSLPEQLPGQIFEQLSRQISEQRPELVGEREPPPPSMPKLDPSSKLEIVFESVKPPKDQAPTSGQTEPWWSNEVMRPIRSDSLSFQIELDSLFVLTAKHSGRVQAVAQKPWVNQMQVQQALAAFDPVLFSDNRFDSTSDPVENTLTTGGPPRLEDNIVGLETGLRGQNSRGESYSMGQRFGHKNSNSNFILPNNQGTARLFGTVTKPLMRGREIDVNRSLILTASFETEAARAEYQETLQTQLFEVADVYWSLYSERATLLQGQRHLARATEIAELLENRDTLDSSYNQILRARATIANRTADLAQAETRIRNLESRLRALINAPKLTNDRNSELVPIQPAKLQPINFNLHAEIDSALERRPELAQLDRQRDAMLVRSQLARDQTKPTLNLVLEGYVAGLQGDSDIIGAFGDQFVEGRPGYAAGVVFERPVGNQAALAAVRQRRFELQQIQQLRIEATETIRAEVETAVRNVSAARQAALSRQLSLDAVLAEVEALKDRWMTLGNDPRLGQLQLNELLNSQDRLLQEEQSLLVALVQYNRAILEVQRATGSLIQFGQ